MEKIVLERGNPQETITAQFQAKFVAWEKRFATQVEEVGILRREIANMRTGIPQGSSRLNSHTYWNSAGVGQGARGGRFD